ncbi:MAG: hypothetical protein AAGE94_15855 [Acidobacteriota bacterium]
MRHLGIFRILLLVGVLLGSVGPSFGQALPGYDRARVDQIRSEKNRRAMDVDGRELVDYSALSVDDWKARSITWALVRVEDDRIVLTSDSEHFDDLEQVRTRRDEASPRREGTELKVNGNRPGLWIRLPERARAAELRCRIEGSVDGELIGIFLTSDQQYVCQPRPIG